MTITQQETAMETVMETEPLLHVEVRVKNDAFININLVREEVHAWLLSHYFNLKVGQTVSGYDSLDHAPSIETITIPDASGYDGKRLVHRTTEVGLDVQVYSLHGGCLLSSFPNLGEGSEEETSEHLHTYALPSASFSGIWEALYYDNQLAPRILHYATRMMALARNADLDVTLMNFNRMILLHGPPGTGKTSLCRALAHKLSIRLGEHYSQGRLIEVNSSMLHSKWFGESGKMISKLFDSIHAIADEPSTLVCVLIDEVETIAGCRERTTRNNEVGDALRATNELLTALDKLRFRSNVMVFCTSNLLAAVDAAFLDRADIKQFVGNPSVNAAYEILRSCMNDLVRCKILTTRPMIRHSDSTNQPSKIPYEERAGHDPEKPFPCLSDVKIHYWNRPETVGYQLLAIAQECINLSGRSLRRLPFLALAMHTYRDPCTVDDGLAALATAVFEELKGNTGDDMQPI